MGSIVTAACGVKKNEAERGREPADWCSEGMERIECCAQVPNTMSSTPTVAFAVIRAMAAGYRHRTELLSIDHKSCIQKRRIKRKRESGGEPQH